MGEAKKKQSYILKKEAKLMVDRLKVISECTDESTRDALIKYEEDNVEWFKEAHSFLETEEMIELGCMITPIINRVKDIRFERAMVHLDNVFKLSLFKIKQTLIESGDLYIGSILSEGELADLFTHVVTEHTLTNFTSSSYITLMFDVKLNGTEGGYEILGDYTGNGYKIKGKLGIAGWK